MSRMIFGVALGFGLVAASGCGSSPVPTQPAAAPQEAEPKKSQEPAPASQVEPPKVEAPKTPPPPSGAAQVVWELDPAKHAVPNAPVRGRVAGADVTPGVLVTAEEVIFRTPADTMQPLERSVTLRLAPRVPGQPTPPPITGRSWKVDPKDAGPEVWVEVKGQPILSQPNGYALTLDLGTRKNGKVTGKVYVSLPDKDQTVLAGTFDAEYFRLAEEPPGADDAPFIAGEVTVTGAAPGTPVRCACAAFLPNNSSVFFPESQAEFKGAPVKFEHTRIEPGRYLIAAATAGGPVVWKWLNVPANGMLNERLTLDVTKTGGLEVTAAADAKGTVMLAPADDAGTEPLIPELFKGFAVMTARANVDIVAGKALVKNLGPGRYEVRLGDERRIVEVIAGKTVEVNMAPPPPKK
ncbi:hypothetical protein R5W24_004720 [Gemmata sp. JC717]|uniref:hypothetical protein n=1 Tax=Gemmata algarum TaxID=2975278 RepID=UPI0021BA3E36|nr:hypothetical protein [Gemmata algarum]MDY3555577.1 hypothetical protein [Gemmata algarum]